MGEFTTLIGRYNATALTLTDGYYSTVALDVKSRVLVSHGTSSMQIGNGNETTPKYLSMLEEDVAAAGGEIGVGFIGVRQDTLASLVSADGDYTLASFNADGALYVQAQGAYDEDSAHSSGDKGNFVLAVRNDTEGSLVSADGDYAPFQVDALGRLRTTAEVDLTPGTEADVGVDEVGDGEIAVDNTWNDVATIALTSGTLLVTAIDGSADKLTQFRLVTDVSGTPTKFHRTFPVTENVGCVQLVFPRPIEITGAANTSVILQAKKLRAGASDANVSGGINGYTL